MKRNIFKAKIISTLCLLVISTTTNVFISGNQPVSAAPPQWQNGAVTSGGVGNDTSCGVASGVAYCWGKNDSGQLGNGTTINSPVPVEVSASGVLSGKTVTDISTSGDSTCVVANDSAYCWGKNDSGQLGNGTTVDSLIPVEVSSSGVLSGKTVTNISVGSSHVCAVASGAAYCWGLNDTARLGNGTVTNSLVPVAVTSSGALAGKIVTQVASSKDSSCAVASGAAYCWGLNVAGELGWGDTYSSLVPVAVDTTGVLSGKTVTQITAAMYSACAVADEKAYCWGSNGNGSLGTGDFADTESPVAVDTSGVLAGKNVTHISTSGYATCVTAGGAVYCWGLNHAGQLGDASYTARNLPGMVDQSGVLAGKVATSVSISQTHACALAGSAFYCWGDETSGALGIGTSNQNTWWNIPTTVVTRSANTTDKVITNVSFNTASGNKIMSVSGEYLVNASSTSESNEVLQRSFISLNGTPLKVCTNGYAALYEQAGYDPAYFTDDYPCYDLSEYNTGLTPILAAVKVYLPSSYDEDMPGVVSVNGSPSFSFNQASNAVTQPSVQVEHKSIEGKPQIGKKPTFNGVAEPGAVVTVTVRSDPVTCTAIADSNGNWSCTLVNDLPAGTHTVTVHVVNPDNTTSDLGPYTVLVAGNGSGTVVTNMTPLAPSTGFERRAAATASGVFLAAGAVFSFGVLGFAGMRSLRAKRM